MTKEDTRPGVSWPFPSLLVGHWWGIRHSPPSHPSHTRCHMTRLRIAAVGLLAAVAGCSGNDNYAPVSGVVKINGKPYPNAVVSFQPIGTKENANPGRGSSAYTDENGRFVLKCDGKINGALVG